MINIDRSTVYSKCRAFLAFNTDCDIPGQAGQSRYEVLATSLRSIILGEQLYVVMGYQILEYHAGLAPGLDLGLARCLNLDARSTVLSRKQLCSASVQRETDRPAGRGACS